MGNRGTAVGPGAGIYGMAFGNIEIGASGSVGHPGRALHDSIACQGCRGIFYTVFMDVDELLVLDRDEHRPTAQWMAGCDDNT